MDSEEDQQHEWRGGAVTWIARQSNIRQVRVIYGAMDGEAEH